MAQVDLATYGTIVFWLFFSFFVSLLLFITFFFPSFLLKISLFFKLALFAFMSIYVHQLRAELLENSVIYNRVLVLVKDII